MGHHASGESVKIKKAVRPDGDYRIQQIRCCCEKSQFPVSRNSAINTFWNEQGTEGKGGGNGTQGNKIMQGMSTV